MDFLFAGENVPFAIALALMLIIGLFEGVATLLGLGVSSVLDNLLPDIDIDVDIDTPDGGGALTKVLGWLQFGKVPALIMLVVLLTAFGTCGYLIQLTLHSLVGWMLPAIIAVIPATAAALPTTRVLGQMLSHVVIRDETEAVSRNSFVGRVAVITLGVARKGSPAEAKFRDQHGTTHYVMVEPDNADDEFTQGESVLLVSDTGSVMRGIKPENTHLKD